MPSSGEYYITSKGRRFRNSLRRERIQSDNSPSLNPIDYENPLDPDYSDLQMDPYIGKETSKDILDIEPRSHRGFMSDESPRSSEINTLQILDDLYKAPYGIESEGWEMETLDWLVRNKYAKFIPFHRSLDVNFETKLGKSYEIK